MGCSLLPYLEYTSLVLKVYLYLVFQVSIHVTSPKRYYFNAVVLNWGWFCPPDIWQCLETFFFGFHHFIEKKILDRAMRHTGSCFPSQGQTHITCRGSVDSQPLDHQGIPSHWILNVWVWYMEMLQSFCDHENAELSQEERWLLFSC